MIGFIAHIGQLGLSEEDIDEITEHEVYNGLEEIKLSFQYYSGFKKVGY